MKAHTRFVSFSQNGEDVLLNRVFGQMDAGVYVEVGANHPRIDSVSRSFYDRGWSGIAIEPNPTYADLYRKERPRDIVIEAAVTDSLESSITLHLIEGTGLSTLMDAISIEHVEHGQAVTDVTVPTIRLDKAITANGLAAKDIHFLMIDTEGAELQVLRSIDLTVVRPWVLIVEATAPGSTVATHESWEPLVLEAGYHFCLFDGLSRFYVSSEKRAELAAPLSYPVCVFDDFVTLDELALESELERLRGEIADTQSALAEAISATQRIHATKSWRLTRPLRAIRGRFRSN